MFLLFKQARRIPIRKLNFSPVFSLYQLSGSMNRYISYIKLKQSDCALIAIKSNWLTLQKTLTFYLTPRKKSTAERARTPCITQHIDPKLRGLPISGSYAQPPAWLLAATQRSSVVLLVEPLLVLCLISCVIWNKLKLLCFPTFPSFLFKLWVWGPELFLVIYTSFTSTMETSSWKDPFIPLCNKPLNDPTSG